MLEAELTIVIKTYVSIYILNKLYFTVTAKTRSIQIFLRFFYLFEDNQTKTSWLVSINYKYIVKFPSLSCLMSSSFIKYLNDFCLVDNSVA